MHEIFTNTTFVLFLVLSIGISLGNIQFRGIALGSSGVLFVALLAGHFGLEVPAGIGGIGTALFVYCVGLGVGNRFFSSLRGRGSKLMLLSVIVVGLAWGLTVVLCSIFGIESEMAAGIFAGALTSTPALAAAAETVSNSAMLNIGYGVAYPFGVIGVVLFVQLLPRLLKQDLSKLDNTAEEGSDPKKIISRVVTLSNPDLYGKNIADFESSGKILCRITRIIVNNCMLPIAKDDSFKEGINILLVGARESLNREMLIFGHIERDKQHPRSFGDERKKLIIRKEELCRKTLGEMQLLNNYGIVISRITRLGVTIVPTSMTTLILNDVVRVIGQPEAIAKFGSICGHRSSSINSTDLLSLTGGVALGILVGNINISLGNDSSFSLGMAGGPLLVALVLGHFGKVGPIVGYMPRQARILIMEFALILFLAHAGIAGGGQLMETLQAQGVAMFFVGATVTLVPMLTAFLIARYLLKMSMPESLGGICGSMTSTPALGAITAKTDAMSPVIAYATAYPAALILMTLLAKALLAIL